MDMHKTRDGSGRSGLARIAVIGAGTYGTHVLDVLQSSARAGHVELAALADIRPETVDLASRRYGVRGYQDYRELLARETLDAVAVVTPDYLHEEIVRAAVAQGLHILCQKPLATESEAGRRMIEAARSSGVMLYVDYHKRFDPAHRSLRQQIRQGRLGKILYGDVYMEDRIEVPSVWFKKWADHSSPAWFLGTHFYDLVSWLTDASPIKVFAHGSKRKLAEMGLDTYDAISAQVVYDNGAVFTFHTSWILPDNFPSIVNQQIRVVGTDGICEIDSQDRGMLISLADDRYCQVINPFAKLSPDDLGPDAEMTGYTCESILHFVRLLDRLRSGQALDALRGFYPDGVSALTATILCEAVHMSLASETIVMIQPQQTS